MPPKIPERPRRFKHTESDSLVGLSLDADVRKNQSTENVKDSLETMPVIPRRPNRSHDRLTGTDSEKSTLSGEPKSSVEPTESNSDSLFRNSGSNSDIEEQDHESEVKPSPSSTTEEDLRRNLRQSSVSNKENEKTSSHNAQNSIVEEENRNRTHEKVTDPSSLTTDADQSEPEKIEEDPIHQSKQSYEEDKPIDEGFLDDYLDEGSVNEEAKPVEKNPEDRDERDTTTDDSKEGTNDKYETISKEGSDKITQEALHQEEPIDDKIETSKGNFGEEEKRDLARNSLESNSEEKTDSKAQDNVESEAHESVEPESKEISKFKAEESIESKGQENPDTKVHESGKSKESIEPKSKESPEFKAEEGSVSKVQGSPETKAHENIESKQESLESQDSPEVKPLEEKDIHEGPKIPKRPVKSTKLRDQHKDPVDSVKSETEEDTSSITRESKAPPPKPKKLSSKIAAFQQMLADSNTNNPMLSKDTKGIKNLPTGKSPNMVNFTQSLNGLMDRNRSVGSAPTESKNISEEHSDREPSANIPIPARPGRAKGPRGKRLPKALQEPVTIEEPKFQISIDEVWHLQFARV